MLFAAGSGTRLVGSVLLVAEVLIKPVREQRTDEFDELIAILARLDLMNLSEMTAHRAVALGSSYGLKGPDACHLATAVEAGADRFITNNRKDFSKKITEIDVTYPTDLR